MKRNSILMALMLLITFFSYAQNDTVYLMKDGFVINKYNIHTEVDSMIFYQPPVEDVWDGSGPTDNDGNTYAAVQIGDQVWMAENLRTTTYNDGTSIPLVTSNSSWKDRTTPAYCWQGNDQSTAVANGYGALYSWYTVETEKLCPSGWHVPSDEEWTVLEDYITEQGYDGKEGTVLKATSGWKYGKGTDNYGFSALPGSCRYSTGAFYHTGYNSYLWSSTEFNSSNAYYRYISYNNANMTRSGYNKSGGYSVRCIRD